jgi:DNA uptake protein ComE-like DNA-binding protein
LAHEGITSKGKVWEWLNSIWMLWAIVTIGFFNYISFFYISYRVKHRKWFYYGLIYSIPFIIVMFTIENVDHWSSDLGMGLLLLSWVVSIFHVFRIRPEYLLRLEARKKLAPKEIASLRDNIKKEYGGAIPVIEKSPSHTFEEASSPIQKTYKAEENTNIVHEVKPIDINQATENEFAAVPALGLIMAKKIIANRKEKGPFNSIEHFGERLELKPHTLERVRPYLYVNELEPKRTSSKDPEPSGRVLDI